MLKWKFVAIISTTKMFSHILSFVFFFFFFPVIVCFANVVVSCVDYMYHICNVYRFSYVTMVTIGFIYCV